MTEQEQFEIEKADFKKRALKKARLQAIILGVSTSAAVLGVMYGLINRIEAQAQRELATFIERQAIHSKQEANEARVIADRQITNFKEQIESLRTQLDACTARNIKDAQQSCGKALAAAEAMVQANLERAMKAEVHGKRQSEIALDLKIQLDKCKTGK